MEEAGRATAYSGGIDMRTRTATKWFGAVVAALTLTMVTSVAPADAAARVPGGHTLAKKADSGWDVP
jgi:hypothetical protein